jgi:hypothetical protein
MSNTMRWLTIAFFVLLAGAIAFGLARDLYSWQSSTEQVEVADIIAPRSEPKAPTTTPGVVRAKRSDGSIVDLATTRANELKVGDTIETQVMTTPWGTIWFRYR